MEQRSVVSFILYYCLLEMQFTELHTYLSGITFVSSDNYFVTVASPFQNLLHLVLTNSLPVSLHLSFSSVEQTIVSYVQDSTLSKFRASFNNLVNLIFM